MEGIHTQHDLIERYLLGELSEAEQTALEDEYFSDVEKYDRLCKAEDELLDRYARGSLTEADRERFERSYLTNPRRRRHAIFAKALTKVLDEAARPAAPQTEKGERIERAGHDLSWRTWLARTLRVPRFALGLTVITAALLIGLVWTWFAIETSRLRARLAEARRESETQRRLAETQARQIADLEAQYKHLAEEGERLQAEPQTARETASPTSRAAPVVFALSHSAFRGSGGQEPGALIIPRGAEEAQLRINLPDHEFPSYQVMLLTIDGREVFVRKSLRPQAAGMGHVVPVNIPARKFTSGDNVLALSGISATGEVETLGKVIVKVKRQ
jgi:hypothetical protein